MLTNDCLINRITLWSEGESHLLIDMPAKQSIRSLEESCISMFASFSQRSACLSVDQPSQIPRYNNVGRSSMQCHTTPLQAVLTRHRRTHMSCSEIDSHASRCVPQHASLCILLLSLDHARCLLYHYLLILAFLQWSFCR